MKLSDIFAAVEKENAHSHEKYGPWLAISEAAQYEAIRGEFAEWDKAYYEGDVDGPHGEKAELIDLINVCCRRLMCLSGEPDA